MKVLVTGAEGQLGQCLQKRAKSIPEIQFLFENRSTLDISSPFELKTFFNTHQPDFCVNCAAYTSVEQAETETETAFEINAKAVKNLAEICKTHHTKLIHISTDYVFNGVLNRPYTEDDSTQPINVYGASKLQGEAHIQQTLAEYFILRTSWLYSEFGHNFFNTISKKAKSGETLNITTEQTGTPTNANDLAVFILKIIQNQSETFGLYHFSNLGEATWYDFARLILEENQLADKTILNATFAYPTKAKRPKFSVLDKSKLQQHFEYKIPHWRETLVELIKNA
ncbi:dTDP-4-dehydrorhamnose reductase [Psychroflexus aestuariivivens]|uniref:dTDP-4-dehydrorhamnose reductase n=1 Tax=Psychroflexus aestuariivivens TaxID=1795040 RepID=UPI000FD7B18E|nr:dTDP-4-dehydrorhamnose reductase [Psychroflexus aestuariivivens]